MSEFAQWRGCLDLLSRRLEVFDVGAVAAPGHSPDARWIDVARLALELDCGEPRRPADFHQFVRRGDDPAPLLAWAREGPDTLRALVGEWTSPGTALSDWAELAFLEYDTSPDGRPAGVSVFLRGEPGREALLAGAFDRASALTRVAPALRGRLDRLVALLPEPASIGAIGWMIGRDGGLRVNVHGLRVEDAGGLFARLGLPSAPEAAAMFVRLADLADKVTVALDLAPAREAARLSGFECFMEVEPAQEPRWHLLSDLARDTAGALPEAMAALLAVPRRALPGDPGLRWPDAWLAAALVSPRDPVPEARVALSHLKFAPRGEGAWRCKAYVFAERGARQTPTAAPRRVLSGTAGAGAIGAARAAGLRFLLDAQDQAGFWRDFDGPIGLADEWVTAVIGFVAAGLREPTALAAALRADRALARRCRDGVGWGYAGHKPPDSDSTAWAIHLARALGTADAPHCRAAAAFLPLHALPEGGVTSYAPQTAIRFTGALAGADDSGYRIAHPCVTAVAAPLIGDAPLAWLAGQQRADGSLPAFWWVDDAYTAAMAIVFSPPGGPVDLTRARAWLADTAADHARTAFGSALRLIGLTGGPGDHAASRGLLARSLVELQQADGSWPSEAQMLRADPWIMEPTVDNSYNHRDERRLFTTAFAVWALDRLAREERP